MNEIDIGPEGGDLSVELIAGTHGHGLVAWLMGSVAGFYFAFRDEPTIYVTGYTVLTDAVKDAVRRLKPNVIVAPAGTASFGFGKDLMFSEQELIELARIALGHVVFNHLRIS